MFWWILLFNILMLFIAYKSKQIEAFIERIQFAGTLPGPKFSELLVNAKKGRILAWLQECQLKYGTRFRVWLAADLFVFFSDPEDIKLILGSNQILHKSVNYQLVEPWLGRGLLTNGGESWHKRRKLLTPAFHFQILSQFKQPMEDNCDILINKLKEVADGREFDIYPFINLFALDVICETAMGIKKHAQNKSDSDYVRAVHSMCRISHKQAFTWWARSSFLFNMSQLGKERNEALKVLHGETERVIKLRRKILEDEGIDVTLEGAKQDFDLGTKQRRAFLDMLLIAQMKGDELTDTDIREEVDTFMFEGHDTTSSTLSFTFYLLSRHEKVQDKAYEEVKLYGSDQPESLKYIEAIIKESLRLYPPVAFFSRSLHEDLKLGDIVVPRGTSVSTFAYMLHRHPEIFPDPERFLPERFLHSEKDIHPYAHVAFSAGPRNCIGQRFAMLELKTTIAKLISEFEFLPAKNFEVEPTAELVLKSKNGFKLRLKTR